MIANRNFEQCEPLTWVGRVPVYLSTAIAFAHGVMMVFTAWRWLPAPSGFSKCSHFRPNRLLESFISGNL